MSLAVVACTGPNPAFTRASSTGGAGGNLAGAGGAGISGTSGAAGGGGQVMPPEGFPDAGAPETEGAGGADAAEVGPVGSGGAGGNGPGGQAGGAGGAGGMDTGIFAVDAAAPPDLAPDLNPGPDPLDDGLRAYWTFDEGNGGTTADRITTYGRNNGTLKNGAGFGAELTGSRRTGMSSSLKLDGVDDYLDISSAKSMPAVNVVKSITFWMLWQTNPAQLTGQHDVIALADPGAKVGIQVGTWMGRIAVWEWDENSGFISLAVPNPGSWHHVAYTFDGVAHTLYLDGGKDVATLARDPQKGAVKTLKMGSYDGANPLEFFRGLVDEVRIYDRPLSATEVSKLYETP